MDTVSDDTILNELKTKVSKINRLVGTPLNWNFTYKLGTVHGNIFRLGMDKHGKYNTFKNDLKSISSQAAEAWDRVEKVIHAFYKNNLHQEVYSDLVNKLRPEAKAQPILLLELYLIMHPEVFFISQNCHDNTKFYNFIISDNINQAIEHGKYLGKLASQLDHFSDKHQKLFDLDIFYRDHLAHSIRVTWLMMKLIKKWRDLYLRSAIYRISSLLFQNNILDCDFNKIHKKLCNALDKHYLSNVGWRNAFIAGIFHDVYLVEEMEDKHVQIGTKHITELSKIRIPSLDSKFAKADLELSLMDILEPGEEEEYDAVSCRAKSTKKEVEEAYDSTKPDDKFSTLLNSNLNDHGVIAAVKLEEMPYESLQAIALHNLFETNIEHKIDLYEHPIAFFLILCDEAQEWGRWVSSKTPGEFIVPADNIKLYIDKDTFLITLDLSQNADQITNTKVKFDLNILIEEKRRNLERLTIPDEVHLNIEFNIVDTANNRHRIFYSQSDKKWEYKQNSSR